MNQIYRVLAFLLVFNLNSYAGTITVTNLNDAGAGSLRAAVASAVSGDTIVFGVTGTILFTGSSINNINKDVHIVGPGAGLLTIDGSGNSGFFTNQGTSNSSISGLTVTNCDANGAIYGPSGILTIKDCVLDNNSASVAGAAFYNPGGTMTIENCAIINNTGGGSGAAIYNVSGGQMTLLNCTISGNSAPSGSGGAIYNVTGGTVLTMVNCTVSSNSASGQAGGVFAPSGVFNSRNSIFADNTAGSNPDFSGTFTSQGYNLIENTAGTTIVGNLTGNITGLDPNLGPLQDNGGNTLTQALLTGSPAIDAGDNTGAPATDQRGFARIVSGTIDMGAFELNNLFVTNLNDAGSGSFREAIIFANGNAGPDTILFDTTLLGSTISLLSALPNITDDSTVINGDINGDNIPDIELDGGATFGNGLTISSKANTVKGLAISNWSSAGISLGFGSDTNLIVSNYIGTDLSGTTGAGNLTGIRLSSANDNRIGDGTPAGRNVICDNNTGLFFSFTNRNRIDANNIGLDAAGNPLGNGFTGVIFSFGAPRDTLIRNTIAFNGSSGIEVDGFGADDNIFHENLIYGHPGSGINITNGAQRNVGKAFITGMTLDSTLFGTSNPNSLIQVYADSSDEGQFWIDTTRADAGGNWSLKVDLNSIPAGLGFLTVLKDSAENTSEFSGPAIAAPSTLVLNTNDSGPGSLRDAMTFAASNPGPDTIRFDTPLQGLQIDLLSGLPSISDDSTYLDGDINGDGAPSITINNSVGFFDSGIRIFNSSYNTVKNLNIIGFDSGFLTGLFIDGFNSRFNTIIGNYIGTDLTGNAAAGTSNYTGISIGGRRNIIGGTSPGERNVISGNSGTGITMNGDTNTVIGNYVGLGADGTTVLPNLNDGISLSSYNQVGDTIPGAKNVISGNANSGIYLNFTDGNLILGNDIGLDAAGNPAGNGGDGIFFSQSVPFDSVILNTIAFNGDQGIDFFGSDATDNTLHFNSIYSNVGKGIRLLGDGGQRNVSSPVILGILADSTVFGTASSNAFIQVYSDSADEGQIFIDTTRADAGGNWSLKVPLTGLNLTALQDSASNTSAFAAPVPGIIPKKIMVVGAGTAVANGFYTENGTYNGRIRYIQDADPNIWIAYNYACWSFCRWEIIDISQGIPMYENNSTASDPPFTGWVVSGFGISPPPFLAPAGPFLSVTNKFFQENAANDGTINDPGTTEVQLLLETFAGLDGEDFVVTGKAQVSNLPAGLNLMLIRQDDTTLTLAIGGTAISSDNTDDVNNLTLSFLDAAFAGNDSSVVNGHDQNDLAINFIQEYSVGAAGNFVTIGSALSGSDVGDILTLAAETFTEFDLMVDKDITIRGQGATQTIVQADPLPGVATTRVFELVDGSQPVSVTMEKMTIRHGNIAASTGGGIFVGQQVNLVLRECEVTDNYAEWGGGGMRVHVGIGSCLIYDCTIANNSINSTNATGAGISCESGTLVINNSTITGNVGNVGAGVWGNSFSINNSTITNNFAFQSGAFEGGGGVFTANPGSVCDIKNTIIAGNTTAGGDQHDIKDWAGSIFNSLGHNIIGTVGSVNFATNTTGDQYGDPSGSTTPNPGATEFPATYDAQLLALANNGGETKTHHPSGTSPAIDAGDNTGAPAFDQRGLPRIVNGTIDVGSVEGNLLLVSTAADGGAGSLREAIGFCNVNPGPDTVLFAPGMIGATITLASALPVLVDNGTVIDGDIDGDDLPSVTVSGNGLNISGLVLNSSGNTIKHLNLIRFDQSGQSAIQISGGSAQNNLIIGNFVGTDLAGTAAAGTGNYYGIQINNAPNNQIGDGTVAGRNVVSGNVNRGLQIASGGATGNLVIGNHFGVDLTGTTALPNAFHGVDLVIADGNQIGDGTAGGRNVISGNSSIGIHFQSAGHNVVLGNYIGTDISGTLDLGNGTDGIRIAGLGNQIGDGTPGGANVISGNATGIRIITSVADSSSIDMNYIGVQSDGVSPLPNSGDGIFVVDGSHALFTKNVIARNTDDGIEFGSLADSNAVFDNSIYGNGSLGISLAAGAQDNVLPPTVDSIATDSTVFGTSAPFAFIHIYKDSAGQGQFFLDSTFADAGGTWSKTLSGLDENLNLTALQDDLGGTSAFSAALSSGVPPAQVTGLVAAAFAPDSVTLTWNANVEADLNNYVVFRNINSGFIPTPTDSIGIVPQPATAFTDSVGLQLGVQYYYRVSAVDLAGNAGLYSSQSSIVFGDSVAPAIPAGFHVLAGNGQVDLNWTANVELDFEQYNIYYGTNPNPTTLQASTTPRDPNDNTINIPLANDQLYYFRITAVDTFGNESGFSNEDAAVPTLEAGNAFRLDGLNDYANVGNVTSYAFGSFNPYTIEAWVKPRAGGAGGMVISKFNGGVTAGWYLSVDAAGRVITYRNVNPWTVVSSGSIPFDEYSHIAATYDGSILRVFINGVEAGSTPFSSNPFDLTTPVLIGARYALSVPAGFFDGEIDEVRLWDVAHDAATISANMTTPVAGDESNLIGLWHLDEPDDTPVTNEGSPAGYNGTLVGYTFPADVAFVPSGAMAPSTPTGLYAVAGDGQVEVVFDANTESDFAKYYVYGGTTPNPTAVLDSSTFGDPTDTSVVVTGLTSDLQYFFRVTAADLSGNESAFSNEDAAVPTVQEGNAVRVNINYVQVAHDPVLNPGSSLTMEAWVKLDNAASNQKLFGKTPIPFTGGYMLAVNGNRIYPEIWDSFGVNHTMQVGFIPSNVWTHLAVTWQSGGDMVAFIDGQEVGRIPASANPIGSNTRPFYLGVSPWDPRFFWVRGLVEEVRLWDVALPEATIQANMNIPLRGDESGLIALWHMDEPTGTTVAYDATPNANNGTLVNGAFFTPSDAMAPFDPQGLVTIPGDQQVQLVWRPSKEPDFLKYRIFGGTTPNPTTVIDSLNLATDTMYTVSPLTNGSINFYRIAAVDILLRQSGFSNEEVGIPRIEAGNAAVLDGTNDFVEMPGTIIPRNEGTISHWVKLDNNASPQVLVYVSGGVLDTSNAAFDGFGDPGSIFEITTGINANGTYGFSYQDGSGAGGDSVSLASSTVLQTGRWYHVAASYDVNGSARLFVDGALESTTDMSTKNFSLLPSVAGFIGRPSFNTNQFDGEMDEVTIWNVALDAAGIDNIIELPLRGDETGLLALWHFDEPPGEPISYESTPSSANVQMQNGATFAASGALAPFKTQNLTAAPGAPDSVLLQWTANTESDLSHYVVYRDTVNGFVPGPADSIGMAGSLASSFVDSFGLILDDVYYYKIAAVDLAGQKGPLSDQGSANFTDPTPLLVKNSNESGFGSFRTVVGFANSTPGADVITFDASLANQTIVLNSEVAVTDDSTTIDGDLDGDRVPDVTISGNSGIDGIVLLSNNNVIKSLNLARFGNGISVSGNNNKVLSSFLGTNLAGTDTSGTRNQFGIDIHGGATGNLIGDGSIPGRNIISGAVASGVTIRDVGTVQNRVTGNFIGTDVNGLAGIGSGVGVEIHSGAKDNDIGSGNVITGNIIGIRILNADSNRVAGNLIGLDSTGTTGSGNLQDGIVLMNVSNVSIGDGTVPGRNVVSGNVVNGIVLDGSTNNTVSANYIGTNQAGGAAAANGSGILIRNASGSNLVLGNVISGNSGEGLGITASSSNDVQANLIGLNPAGTAAIANGANGIRIYGGSTLNRIGNGLTAGRNFISGNLGRGVVIEGAGTQSNQIIGNRIGTNSAGAGAVSNALAGILLRSGSAMNDVGNGTSGGRNLVSGNLGAGIRISSSSANRIRGNRVGLNAAGNAALPNQFGMILENASRNVVGGSLPGDANTISGNTLGGIVRRYAGTDNRISRNRVGTGPAGAVGFPNLGFGGISIRGGASGDTLRFNTIGFNTGDGIVLDSVTTDSNLVSQNSIFRNTGKGISITNGAQGGVIAPTIRFYDGDLIVGDADPSHIGSTIEIFLDSLNQGKNYIASTTVQGDATWSFSGLGANPNLVATATLTTLAGNTSEFSTSITLNHKPLVAVGIPDTTVLEDAGVIVIADLNSTFFDEDGDTLTFEFDATDSSGTILVSKTLSWTQKQAPGKTTTGLEESELLGFTSKASMFEDNGKLPLDSVEDTSAIVDIRIEPSGLLLVTTRADLFGSVNILLTARDARDSATTSFDFNVLPVNDAPRFTAPIPDTAFNEDDPTAIIANLNNVFYDVEDDSLTYSVFSDSAVVPPASSITLTVRLPLAKDGNEDKHKARSGIQKAAGFIGLDGASANTGGSPQSVDLLQVFEIERSADGTMTLRDRGPVAALKTGSLLKGFAGIISVTIDGSGNLLVTPLPDEFGVADVTVTAHDGLDSTSLQFAVTVRSINDAPTVVSAIADRVYDEDSGENFVPLDSVFGDIDSQVLNLTVVSENSNIGVQIRSDSLLITPVAEFSGNGLVILTAEDDSLASVSDSFLVTITEINDPPLPFSVIGPADTVLDTDDILFEWETAPDDGTSDSLVYRLRVSTVPDLASTVIDVTIDSTSFPVDGQTLENEVDYYWFVEAIDRSAASTTTDTVVFSKDTKGPDFIIGVYKNPGVGRFLGVYVIASEFLPAAPAVTLQRVSSSGTTTKTLVMSELDTVNHLFYSAHALEGTGTVTITATGQDVFGRSGSDQVTFVIGSITKQNAGVASSDGNLNINVAGRDLLNPGDLMITSYTDEKLLKSRFEGSVTDIVLGKGAEIPESWNVFRVRLNAVLETDRVMEKQSAGDRTSVSGVFSVGPAYDVIFFGLEFRNFAALSIAYEWVTADEELDERKVGIYRYDEVMQVWEYEGGEGDPSNRVVSADIRREGLYRVMYNPEHELLPTKYDLSQNYPNPFNPVTTIRYELPVTGKVVLKVYNILGQEVATLVQGIQERGRYQVQWNSTNRYGTRVSSGVYIYRINAGKFQRVKKMMLVK